ncbi:hypothetical protein BDN71DRAFT_1589051 [Pleurotus eryngii]|uniref:Uncharacterized protein n=1 Tax=Pleurotus eryngii TaxID=5323 RepID=A0A9P6D7Y8_PLEER|nr:hypothetical protein BDN71DRAFT_1589051 [Pleurotus eryngii]
MTMKSQHPRRVAIGQWPTYKFLAVHLLSPTAPGFCHLAFRTLQRIGLAHRLEGGWEDTDARGEHRVEERGGFIRHRLWVYHASYQPPSAYRFRSSPARGFGREPYSGRVPRWSWHRLLCSRWAALTPPSTLSVIVSSGFESTPRDPAGAHQYGRKPPVSFWPTFARGLTLPFWGGFILRVCSSQWEADKRALRILSPQTSTSSLDFKSRPQDLKTSGWIGFLISHLPLCMSLGSV